MGDFGLREELQRIREAANQMGADAPEDAGGEQPRAEAGPGEEDAAAGGDEAADEARDQSVRADGFGVEDFRAENVRADDIGAEDVRSEKTRQEPDDAPDVVDVEPDEELGASEEPGAPADLESEASEEATEQEEASTGERAPQGGSALEKLSGTRAEGRRESGELGLEQELRLALDVLEELLEMAPDRLDVLSRRVRYARRLDDADLRDEAESDLVTTLADSGRETAARLAAEVFVHDRPEADAMGDLLARLRRERAREALPRVGGEAGPEAGAESGVSSLRDTVVGEVLEAPDAEAMIPLLLAFHAVESGSTDEHLARRHLAVYLREQGRLEEAREMLEEAVDGSLPEGPRERAEALAELAVTELRLGDEDRARDRMERLAEIDDGVRELLEDLL